MIRRLKIALTLALFSVSTLAAPSTANLIAYNTGTPNRNNLMVMDDSGADPTEIYRGIRFSGPSRLTVSPPLPGGAWVAFEEVDLDRGAGGAFYRLRTDGTDLIKVLCWEGTSIDGAPHDSVVDVQWSPTGTEILVQTLTPAGATWVQLGLLPADFAVGSGATGAECESELLPIYDGNSGGDWVMEGTAAWNDDGSRIALFEYDQVGGIQLVILERGEAGWGPTVVPTDVEFSGWFLHDLDWQRGGSLLAFSTRLGTDPQGPVWLNWIDSTTGAWGYITEGGARLEGTSPSWSPDGSQLVFTDRRDNLVKWTYLGGPTAEGHLEGLTEVIGSGELADWQRDAFACTSDSECEDGNPCTDDSCVDSACVHNPLTGSSCDDGNDCTVGDLCSAGLCAGVAVLDDTSCDSGAGICCGGICSTAACVSDGDCDDGDECTFDTCFDGNTCAAYCVNEPDPQCPVCLPKGEACTSDDECCSGQCHPVKGTCK